MEILFISGLPCSGKSFLAKRLVETIGRNHAVRLPMDHYFLDAPSQEYSDQHSMLAYQRERLDWTLCFNHIDELCHGRAIDTPRYDWETHRRVSLDSGIGRTTRIEPLSFLFVDGIHPSLDQGYKHLYVNPSWQTRKKLIQIRSCEMNLPDQYETILRQVEQSSYGESLSWLSDHCWKNIHDPFNLDLRNLCYQCGWDKYLKTRQ